MECLQTFQAELGFHTKKEDFHFLPYLEILVIIDSTERNFAQTEVIDWPIKCAGAKT